MVVQILNDQTKKFIYSLGDDAIGKTFRAIDLLEKYGNTLGMPHAKRLERNLFELRLHGKQEIRLFYTVHTGQAFIVHGFMKKTMETPSREVATARARIRAFTKDNP